ncbi:CYFA0S02e04654g1_1 [Cyberlindnera fabianii]|uniref:Peptide hydrolase n=1 Tax=Cyberlindnera fabianii TaxID=36022 RepID=A0A061AMB2_CYBFA|nr:Vacuolar membrane protease [Cyberlindnera fabianii]CDR38696.1 CYFA0S02e04654g1_1 [Cyberlindnera fabianii]
MSSNEAEPAASSSGSIHKGSQPPAPEPAPDAPPQPTRPTSVKTKKETEPSIFIQSIRAIFGFRKTSLTLFVALTYLVVLLIVPLAKRNTLSLPEKEPSILTSSWLDLQTISHKPHPYVSHANDEVHDYILSRAEALAKSSKLNITIDDDRETGLTWFEVSQSWKNSTSDFFPLHRFESGNVLVKIEGKDPNLDGVLLSAHYDSVATAYGTTDDGTGIASMLGVLEHYALTGKQPLRTIVFNFNNNEEFGLFGAEAFFNHPWSKEVKYVINLEGTGTGERAVLFRTTDYDVGKHYSSVRSPFATSIFQQAFATGVIRSETDYRVYTKHGMRGFDIAFYKPRSLYHTTEDSIRHTSKNALWHMLGNSLDLTMDLANSKKIGGNAEDSAVYFDFLGLFFVVFPMSLVTSLNIALLVAAPLAMLFFGLIISKRKIWSVGFSFFRLPISLLLGFVAAKFVNHTIYFFNPFIVSSDFMSPLLTVGATFLFVNYAVLTTFQAIWPVHDLKLVITLEIFAVHWILLLATTVSAQSTASGSGYYILTIFYTLYGAAAIFGLFGLSVVPARKKSTRPSSYGSISPANNADSHTVTDADNENSPLLSNSIPEFDSESSDHSEHHFEDDEAHPEHNSFAYDWSIQYLIVVPLTTLLSYVSIQLCLEGLNQTVQESLASHELVFRIILYSAITLGLPLLPFAYKLNFLFALALIFTIIGGGLNALTTAPFSADSPIKFRVAQTIDLSGDSVPYMEAFGREELLPSILSDLPSVKSSSANVTCESVGDGNELCHYSANRPYLINGTASDNDFNSYLDVQIIKSKDTIASPYSPMKVELNITALDNRFCYVKFNSSSYTPGNGKSPVRMVTYFNDTPPANTSAVASTMAKYSAIPVGGSKDADGNDVFKWLQGIDEIHLHKTNWSQTMYHLGIQWVPKWLEDGEEQQPIDSPENDLGVTVSCYWGEWDDVAVVDGEPIRKLRAFDELLQYAPQTASWSNRFEGLVRIDKYVQL